MAEESPKGGMAMLMALKPKSEHAEPDADDMGGPSDGDADNMQMARTFDIDMPDGFKIPDGKEPGQAFDSVVKMHVTDDGRLAIDEIEGVPTNAESATMVEEGPDGEQEEVLDTVEAGQGTPTQEQPIESKDKVPKDEPMEMDPMKAIRKAIRRK